MAIKRETRLHEILIRFDEKEDGTELCRAIDVETVTDGDEVISRKELPPREIRLEELQALVDDKAAVLTSELSRLKNTRDETAALAAQRGAELEAVTAEVERLRSMATQFAQTVADAASAAAAEIVR